MGIGVSQRLTGNFYSASAKMYKVYFIQSLKNKKVYVGFTKKNPRERLAEHNLGKSQWTRDNGPFKLIYYETYYCEKDAVNREKFYKSGFGKRIKQVIISEVENNRP